jgi:hypothetical protein
MASRVVAIDAKIGRGVRAGNVLGARPTGQETAREFHDALIMLSFRPRAYALHIRPQPWLTPTIARRDLGTMQVTLVPSLDQSPSSGLVEAPVVTLRQVVRGLAALSVLVDKRPRHEEWLTVKSVEDKTGEQA